MTLDEQDIIIGALNRLCAASICLCESDKTDRAFEGAMWVIGDIEEILTKIVEDAKAKSI